MIASTSIEAHESTPEEVRVKQRARIEKAILESGSRGMTNDELVTETGISLQSVCGCRNWLVRKGFVLDSGLTRLNAGGKKCAVVVHKAVVV